MLGAVIMGAGLIGVWITDLRSRQHRDLIRFSEAIRYVAVFYDGVVVPGALILLFSGTWFTVKYFGGWGFIEIPGLSGMIFLFVFEFIEGNTITRLYFMKLRKITSNALEARVMIVFDGTDTLPLTPNRILESDIVWIEKMVRGCVSL